MSLRRPRAAAPTRSAPTAAGRSAAGRSQGLGEGSTVTVKGARATAAQRATIDAALTEAYRLHCSRRVMVAIVMCITQESNAGDPRYTRVGDAARSDTIGAFQQGPEWISRSNVMNVTLATRAFLLGAAANVGGTDLGKRGWKQWFGGLKSAPANLPEAIHRVQGNARASDYAPWESEAGRTVDAWLGSSSGSFGRKFARYEFTRGERGGQRENSWDASGRLADEVAARRWAARNVFYYVSEDELLAGAPSLTVHGNEAWLLGPPQLAWGTRRPVTEVTLRVLADRWTIMPGGVVVLAFGPLAGRYIVKSCGGDRLDSPEAEVVIKRPTLLRPEPAPDAMSAASSGSSTELVKICRKISAQDRKYRLGGGHGKPLARIGPSEALDCSSSVSLALWYAHMFHGGAAITSGEFASSWGAAGRGREFTVWANGEHVWIEFYGAGTAKRFDTSPKGQGPSGPHVRTRERTDQSRFTARHWPGH